MLAMFWSPRICDLRMAASWCGVNLWGARAICGIRWHVDGLENVPADTRAPPHIVMSKHSSTWETLSLNLYFPPLAFVAKKELLSIPFFGWGFALASPITIDRKAGTDAMEQIVDAGPGALRRRASGSSSIPRARASAPARARSTRRAARAWRSR